MTRIGEPDRERDFEDRWREWASHPPHRSPASAARAVRTRLSRPPAPRWWLPAAAAALAVTALLSVRSLGPPGPVPASLPLAGAEATPPLGDGEVLIWLDKDTPLYMTYQQPSGGNK